MATTNKHFELDYITVEGFKSIRALKKLELGQINVIIGPNGSGKSNFIGVFSFLHVLMEGRLQDYVGRAGGADKFLYFGSRNTQKIHIKISFENEVNQYEIILTPTEDDRLFVSLELAYFWDKARFPSRPYSDGLPTVDGGKEAGISDPKVRKTASWARAHLSRWRLYHVHDTSSSSPMKKTADLNDNQFLRPDGSNLAAFLYLLSQQHEESYGLIRKTIQRVTPFFDDFVLSPSRLNENKIRLEWKHKNSDLYFDASSLSDGTLRFIILSTLFLQPQKYKPSVILVDEPELGLHPYAITMLGSLVKQASLDTQVIMSTQSPLLLDQFAPEDVLVAGRSKDATEFERLDSKALSSWLDDYSLGQLWEKNEIGGRP